MLLSTKLARRCSLMHEGDRKFGGDRAKGLTTIDGAVGGIFYQFLLIKSGM
jgi:hypothetical protein